MSEQSVDHPYIVKLFEVLTIKNYIGIVLQRAAGNTKAEKKKACLFHVMTHTASAY